MGVEWEKVQKAAVKGLRKRFHIRRFSDFDSTNFQDEFGKFHLTN